MIGSTGRTKGQITYLMAHDAHHSVLGYVIIKWRGDARHEGYPILEDLIVRTELFGRGIGTRLLVRAEMLSAQRSCTWIGLNVQPANNPRARSLYERLGYCDSGEPPHYDVYSRLDEYGERQLYEDCCIHLVKALSPENER